MNEIDINLEIQYYYLFTKAILIPLLVTQIKWSLIHFSESAISEYMYGDDIKIRMKDEANDLTTREDEVWKI